MARDAGIARQTATEFFQILVDTLLGSWIPAWKLKRATKQAAHPKFFLFDTGVTRHLAGTAHATVHPEERGALFETMLLHELRAFLHYRELDWPLAYWKTHTGSEVDFVIDTPDAVVAIEAKTQRQWDSRSNAGLLALRDLLGRRRVELLGVYDGEREMVRDDVRVLPWRTFLQQLWQGGLLAKP